MDLINRVSALDAVTFYFKLQFSQFYITLIFLKFSCFDILLVNVSSMEYNINPTLSTNIKQGLFRGVVRHA